MAHGHTTSCLVRKLVTELEVTYNADKYYQIFKNREEVSRAIPHIYRSTKVLEGHGKTSGCKKGKTLILKESTTYNDETRMICHSVVGGDIANHYKIFNATLLVKGNFSSQVAVIAHPL
ncbi:major latex protein 15-like [Papaver somniferum]|uniref:major latex protein 15-like n=1 Tax=Papaver somniferum TaxID=3469 RepID=UPI000E6FA134|nr:major latex protein 15-like [Papaver somniferum]